MGEYKKWDCPGDLILDFMNRFNYNQKKLATKTGISPHLINQMISNKAKVSAKSALLFEHVFRISARRILVTQADYLIKKERKRIAGMSFTEMRLHLKQRDNEAA